MPDPSPPEANWPPETRFTWRARSLLLFGLGGSALVLGLLFSSPPALLLAVPLLVSPLTPWLLAPAGGTEVRAEGRVVEGDRRLEVRWELSFAGRRPAGELVTRTGTVRGTRLLGYRELETRIPSKGNATVRYTFEPYRPLFEALSPPRVLWRDALGLSEIPLQVTGDPVLLESYPPELKRLRQVNLRHTTLLPGEARSSRSGPGGEFYNVRPYLPGENRNAINWWATARRGDWMSNEFYAERSGELLLVVDLRHGDFTRSNQEDLLGVCRAAAVGIARELLREKVRVGLALFQEFPRILPLRSGRVQRYQIEKLLSGTEITGSLPPVERLAIAVSRSIPSGTPTLFLSPLDDEETFSIGYQLRRRGYPTLLLSPSPLPLYSEQLDQTGAAGELAARMAALLRRRRVTDAWAYVPVIDWTEYGSLAPLVNFLRRPATANRGAGL